MFYDMASWLAHLDRTVEAANHQRRVEEGLRLLEDKERRAEAKRKAKAAKPPAEK